MHSRWNDYRRRATRVATLAGPALLWLLAVLPVPVLAQAGLLRVSASTAAQAPQVPGAVRRELNRAEALLRRQVARLGPDDSGVQVVRNSEQVILRVPVRLLFPPDSEQLRRIAQTQRMLLMPEQLLHRRRRLIARVDVYSDNIGGATYNHNLSEGRAEALLAALTASGIAPRRLSAQGAGLVAALSSNDTPEGRMQNRRVEFVFERPNAQPP